MVGPELEYFLLRRGPGLAERLAALRGRHRRRLHRRPRADPDGHLLRTLRHLRDLRIGVTDGNHEFDGGQFEINLTHSEALDAADRAFRFKSAVKELARTEGRLATFMAKPFNDAGGSGFHLHVSCDDERGRNAFDDPSGAYGLSATARHAIAGVLAHAPALAALANPTINSYKRFGPDTLAPWLIDWGLDNRSAMLRIPPERGSGARLELRLGDASANPYLLIAGTLAAALLGVRAARSPPPRWRATATTPPERPCCRWTWPPRSTHWRRTPPSPSCSARTSPTSYLTYKRDEVERFQRHVTDWEFTEYAYHL